MLLQKDWFKRSWSLFHTEVTEIEFVSQKRQLIFNINNDINIQTTMAIYIVIPARYYSSRFPGKPLADIAGKPMIQRVYEASIQVEKASRVIVATDDLRIFNTVKNFGGDVVMTSRDHPTGTDRVIEVAENMSGDIFINVQGDEPLIRPRDINLLIDKMTRDPNCQVATLCHPIPEDEALNPNVVKVVRSANGRALYFSRRRIPYAPDSDNPIAYLKHVGIYGYRRKILTEYKHLPYSHLEDLEKLEQLRLMEAGIPIDVMETKRVGRGVDTPEDLEVVLQILKSRAEVSGTKQEAILP